MRIAVFGATGRTGRLVAAEAINNGHEVSVFVRDPSRLPEEISAQGVTVGRYPLEAAGLLKGHDAVICALASGRGVLTGFAEAVVPAMQEANVTRLVSLVGAGVAVAGDRSSFGRSFMIALMKLVARDVLADATAHAQRIIESELNWTLVRPPRLTDGPAGDVVHAPFLSLGPTHAVSRRNLAAFMLECCTRDLYPRGAPMVADA